MSSTAKDKRMLIEYAGRSTAVLRMAYVLRDLILSIYRRTNWNSYMTQNGTEIYYKQFSVPTNENNELENYISSALVNVYLLPNGMGDVEFSETFNISLDNRVDPTSKTLYLNVGINEGEDISEKIQGILEHELLHLFQYAMSGGNVSTPKMYFPNSDSNENGSIYSNTLTNNQRDAVNIIDILPYYFSNIEIDANIQKIWSELVRYGDYRKCTTFWGVYNKALIYYNVINNLYTNNNNNEVNKEFISKTITDHFEVPSSYYFRTVGNGVKRFKTKMGKLIAAYNERNS